MQCKLYRGYTCRHVHQRVEEHKHSVIGKHFLEKHNLKRMNLSTNFKECRGKLECLIFEMLIIRNKIPKRHGTITITPIAKNLMLYRRSLIYMLSMLHVRLTIKVKVGIPESFKVGWYPHKITGSSHLKGGDSTKTCNAQFLIPLFVCLFVCFFFLKCSWLE